MKKIELNESSRWRYADQIGEIRPAITYWKARSTAPKKITWLVIFLWTIVLAYVMVDSCVTKVNQTKPAISNIVQKGVQ